MLRSSLRGGFVRNDPAQRFCARNRKPHVPEIRLGRDKFRPDILLAGCPGSSSVDCLYVTPRDLANPLQFLGGEVRLLLVAGAFFVPQPRFLRDAVELRFWHAEQQGSSCLRVVFWDLIVHNLPLPRRARLNVSAVRCLW